MDQTKHRRPVFLDLLRIRMPVGALTSIAHRITGVLLALGTPWAVYLLDLSLQEQRTYDRVMGLFEHWTVRAAAILLAWALAHHSLAGIRHLLADIDVGSGLPAARRSAWLVNLGGIAVAILAAGALM